MDNAAIDTERANLWKTMHKLEQMVHISKTLDQRLDDDRVGASHGRHGRAGDDQSEAGARADHRAEYDHRRHDRFDRRDAAYPDGGHPRAGGKFDDPPGDAAARFPEYLRHDGPDR